MDPCELVAEGGECPLLKRVYRQMRIREGGLEQDSKLWCADLTCPCRMSHGSDLQKMIDQY